MQSAYLCTNCSARAAATWPLKSCWSLPSPEVDSSSSPRIVSPPLRRLPPFTYYTKKARGSDRLFRRRRLCTLPAPRTTENRAPERKAKVRDMGFAGRWHTRDGKLHERRGTPRSRITNNALTCSFIMQIRACTRAGPVLTQFSVASGPEGARHSAGTPRAGRDLRGGRSCASVGLYRCATTWSPIAAVPSTRSAGVVASAMSRVRQPSSSTSVTARRMSSAAAAMSKL